MVNSRRLLKKHADQLEDLYDNLSADIYDSIVDMIKASHYENIDKDSALLWQAQQLPKASLLNQQMIQVLAKYSGVSEKQIDRLVTNDGLVVSDEIDQQLIQMTGQRHLINPQSATLLKSLRDQMFRNLNNVTNQTLITTNYHQSAAMLAYQKVVTQSTVETVVGLKTHEKAIYDNIYKMIKQGITTPLIDKGGHRWSLEAYSRTVIESTSNRVYNSVRMQGMDAYNITLATMDAHPASRPACAPIQGHIVNTVSSGDSRFNSQYDSIYNHGFGEAAGTFGINCKHHMFPFVEGVSTNSFEGTAPDPDVAIANSQIQARQRLLERSIRKDKQLINAADKLGDQQGLAHYKAQLANHRSVLRQHVAENDFLHRDYSREKVVTKLGIDYNKAKLSDSQRHTKLNMASGGWSDKINLDKQADHMESTHLLGKSYLFDKEDPQELFNEYAGTGELRITKKGTFSNVETVNADHNVGVDANTGKITPNFKIHHGKRPHIVPVVLPKEG
ncbi:hypothetical protein BSQ39_08240 [Loigolactobacillus backii]|uniref:phage minor capsid protein n=1 Tax=Loigolactobacillus backii TaxID=375175 RepID=UPI000C1C9FC7|nr:phage minor capsid protein [Loigolactobacillus backii]PIO83553.1 hypothetical protein BSQ39_08240 [Loigolactobacillus backii]